MFPRLLLVATGLLFCVSQAFAQVYEPGYLVRSNGDTLRGEIENGFWVEPPTAISFRPTAASNSTTFKPRQLRAVSFTNGRLFHYAGLPIDHAARAKVGNLPYENRADIHTDSLLAEVLVDGPLTLVQVALSDRPVHYVLLRPNRPPLDLSERKYLRQTVDRAWLLTDGNNYRGQLTVYLGDCPAAVAVIAKAPFTTKGLTEVVQAYNEACSPARKPGRDLLALAAPRRRVSFQGGVLAGARYNRVESYSSYYNGDCVDCKVRPFGGLYAELLQPGRAFAFYGELSASKYQSRGAQYASYTPGGVDLFATYDYSAWLGTARLGVRYLSRLPHEQQLIIGAGYELNFIINPQTAITSGPAVAIDPSEFYYASPTLLPNVTLGWRSQRLTLFLDGQLYASSDYENNPTTPGSTIANAARFTGAMFFGSNFAVRLGTSYRLGRNADVARPAK